MHTVNKQFTFDAAHRLMGYEGKCKNLHGHTYKMEVEMISDDLDKLNMVIDFGIIKEHFKKWVDDNWDHATILRDDDPLIKPLRENNQHVFQFVKNPTAESMAEYAYLIFLNIITQGPKGEFGMAELSKVIIWETPTSFASYSYIPN